MHSYLFFALFFCTGIAGLIYETIWTHYLKLFLGHAAYAQTLVLAIYMGGLAAGAWIAGSRIERQKDLLRRYAYLEIILGIAALLFHDVFRLYQTISYDTVLPLIGNPSLVFLYKWISAAGLIVPQSMLLGATFPYMAAGFIRRYPGTSGYKIAILYFVNTFGASAGVVLSGFFLIGAFGLHGTIITAGIIDISAGFAVLAICRYIPGSKPSSSLPTPSNHTTGPAGHYSSTPRYLSLMIIAGATATSSFMYEIGWIRMLSLVLGSSTHSFELMLSTFILGIALGSFFIRKKIDSVQNIPQALVISQTVMGSGALLSVFTYAKMFHLMEFFMSALKGNDAGYFFFNLAADFICMLVMLPSTICAGMILPLIIHYFYRQGSGESAVGRIYSVNTLGGIAGIILSVWLLMPVIGVRLLITAGGLIDIGIGLYILYTFRETSESVLQRFLPAICAVLAAFSLSMGRIDPSLAASGVFRNGTISDAIRIVSHKDGRTATVSLYRNGNNLVLCTNGKPDAAVNVRGGICGDEYTMALCGVLPLAIREDGSRAAIIGMGSGMTAHYLLYDTTLRAVDIIEIEPEMARAAVRIGDKVEQAFNAPRAALHIDDAKSFLSASAHTYDIIISEPSNPWVSGVAGLFSREFFGRVRTHLSNDGILVQWFHRYESDVTIIASIIKALREHFPHYRMYMAGSDMIVIAAADSSVNLAFKRDPFVIAPLAGQLGAMGFTKLDDLHSLRFASEKFLNALVDLYQTPPNSDFFPYVDLNAVKYRFIDDNIRLLDTLSRYIIPIRKILESDTGYIAFSPRNTVPELSNLAPFIEAKQIYLDLVAPRTSQATRDSTDISSEILLLDYIELAPDRVSFAMYFSFIIEILEKTLPYLSRSEMSNLWNSIAQKTAGVSLTEDDLMWMRYFKALCEYDMPRVQELSRKLLPETGPVEDEYVHRMLLTSLLASSTMLNDTITAANIYCRYVGRNDPGIVLRMAKWPTKRVAGD
ncbi:MAG: hypothetical protein JW863_04130 [Chitinispirillaceae bacterium]|nr:hypothetical protein [Chitinispirillaceae bacterium]